MVGNYIEAFREYYLIQCILYMASGVLALILVGELRKMFVTVLKRPGVCPGERGLLKEDGKVQLFDRGSLRGAAADIAHACHGGDHHCVRHRGAVLLCAVPGVREGDTVQGRK